VPSPGEIQRSKSKEMPRPENNPLANSGSFQFSVLSSAIKDKFVNHTENHREKRVISDLNKSGIGKSGIGKSRLDRSLSTQKERCQIIPENRELPSPHRPEKQETPAMAKSQADKKLF
jgi:hypothetical protein